MDATESFFAIFVTSENFRYANMRDIYRISKKLCVKYNALTFYNIMRSKKVNTELKARMLQICSELGVSPNKLSEDSGMSREYIRQMKEYVAADLLRYIHRTYPHINLIWLLTGEGEMKNESSPEDLSLLIKMLNEEREKNKALQEKIQKLEEELRNNKA